MTAWEKGCEPWPKGAGEMAVRIRGHDWGATPLGPIETWPEALKTAVDLILDSIFPASLHCGAHYVQIYNDAYVPLIGTRHPAALGAGSLETFSALRDFLAPLFEEVRSGKTVLQESQLFRYARQDVPEDSWFSMFHQPVRDGNRVIAVLSVGVEVTERVLAERRRGEAQAELECQVARQAFLLRLSDAVRPLSDPPRIMEAATEAVGRELGLSRCGYGQSQDSQGAVIWLEAEWTDGVAPPFQGPLRLDAFGPGMANEIREGRTVRLDDVRTDPRTRDAAETYAKHGVGAAILAPLVKDAGLVAILYASQPTARRWTDDEAALVETVAERTWSAVERARTEAALRKSETRRRALLDSIDQGYCVIEKIDPAPAGGVDYRYIEANPALGRLSGIEGVLGRTIRQVLPEDEADAWIDSFESVRRSGEPLRFRQRLKVTERLLELFAFPFEEVDGRQIGILFQDITEDVAAEKRLKLVVNELNHRVKNNLAIVQAIAGQTFRSASDPAAAADDFMDRLVALGRANDVLTSERAASVDLGVMARQALAAHVGQGARLELAGPPVELAGPVALALSMALHELATNAVKYGAWSNRRGEVGLRWEVRRDGEAPPRLNVTWRERGGPPVTPPHRRGFGSRLIERGLSAQLEGRARLEFEPDGLVCEIDAPLPVREPAG